MGQSIHPDVLDTALDELIAHADTQVLCSAQPTTFSEASTDFVLAQVSLGPSDFAKIAGNTGGRRLNIAARSGVTVSTTGVGSHIALLDSVQGRVLFVAECPAQSLQAGAALTFGAWQIELTGPA